jgi:hypothetical protein
LNELKAKGELKWWIFIILIPKIFLQK